VPELKDKKIAIIGLGYVGLPLAVEFGKQYDTIGFDIDEDRVSELQSGRDKSLEIPDEELAAVPRLRFSIQVDDLKDYSIYIITVPTPIDEYKRPDLTPLIHSSEMVGSVLQAGDIVIYESTVYPGATEEVCVPILEKFSRLTYNQDFFIGYSPERINPGDKKRRLTNIQKVTSGSTPEAARIVDDLYRSIVAAGTHLTSSIRVAEAAKVIENTQRDVNIALINELALLFEQLGIDTLEVLEAAGTKWNFLPFRPGLVGGHCIGVDPYYLTHKAQEVGYHPQMILSGRRLNDGMGAHVAEQVIKLMTKKRIPVPDAKILVLGFTFKENCPDIRNTRVIDLIDELESYHAHVDVYDPWVDSKEAHEEYGIELISDLQQDQYDAIILAVGHNQFKDMNTSGIRQLGKSLHVLYDVKSILPKADVDGRL
jgi:UDP-N-acetyl-D-galactosamine dehydrogenase